MKNKNAELALLTIIYDSDRSALFEKRAAEYFLPGNIHIACFNGAMSLEEDYFKRIYFHKIVKVKEYIKENILGRYKYILFLDAFDTNFIREPSDIIDLFDSFDCNIVFSGEQGIWPKTDFSHLYEKKEKLSPFCYLNAGGYIGYTDKIFEHLEKIAADHHIDDDQGAWSIEYLHTDDIRLDQQNSIFFNTQESKEYVSITDNTITIKGSNPIIVHDNGFPGENTIPLAERINEL